MGPRFVTAICAVTLVLALPASAQRGRGGGGGRGRAGGTPGFSVDTAISALALAPDDSVLAGATSTGIELWEPNGKVEHTLLVQGGEISTLVFNADGRRIAGGDDTGELSVWNTSPGNAVWSVNTHHQRIVGLRYSPDDSKLVSASEDGTVQVWDAAIGKPISMVITNPPAGSDSGTPAPALASPTPTGATASVATSGANPQPTPISDSSSTGDARPPVPTAPELRCAAFSNDGKQVITVSVSGDKVAPIDIRIWDAASGIMKSQLKPPNLDPRFAVLSQDGKYVLVKDQGSGQAPYLISATTGEAPNKPPVPSDDPQFPWDNRRGGTNTQLRVYLSEHNSQLMVTSTPVSSGVSSRSGSSGSSVTVYDAATMKQLFAQQSRGGNNGRRRRRNANPEGEGQPAPAPVEEALTGAILDDVHNVVVLAQSITTLPPPNSGPMALKEPRGRVELLHFTLPDPASPDAANAAAAG